MNPQTRNWIFFLAFLVLMPSGLVAQRTLLATRITYSCQEIPLDDALKEIGELAGFSFSYNAKMFRGDSLVSLSVHEKKISQVLKKLLGNQIQGKEVGHHVILSQDFSREERLELKPKTEFSIRGNLTDALTGEQLKDASIYLISNRKTEITATNGSYKLDLSAYSGVQGIYFGKLGYLDTVIFVRPVRDMNLDVALMPKYIVITPMISRAAELRVNVIDSMPIVAALVPYKSMVTSKNLQVGGTRAFQVSLIPNIGTNWMSKGSYTSAISFNLLAGYNGGVNGVEVGGLLNMVRNNVRGMQIGGFGNIVGRDITGLQIGGLFNWSLGHFKGVQVGGILNYQADTLTGVQVGGLCNVLEGKMQGTQVAGLVNVTTGHADGWQVGGLVNVAVMDVEQAQIAGLVNYGRHIYGIQLGGLVSIAYGNVKGVQVGGLLNYARTVQGVQLGLINISRDLEIGVPVGFYSYVHKGGLHEFALYGDEVFYANVAHRTGTRKFYNVFQVGTGQSWMVNWMYGLGTSFRLGDKWTLSVEAISGLVFTTSSGLSLHGCLTKLLPAVEYRIAKRLAVFGGPTYNLYAYDTSRTLKPNGIAPYTFFNQINGRQRIQMWIGGTLGFRF